MTDTQITPSPLLALDMRFRIIDMLCRTSTRNAINTKKAIWLKKRLSDFYLDSLTRMDEKLERLFSEAFPLAPESPENNPTQTLTAEIKALAKELELDNFTPDLDPIAWPTDRYDEDLLECVPFFREIFPLYLAANREKMRLLKEARTRKDHDSTVLETRSPNELKGDFERTVSADHTRANSSYIIGTVRSYDTHIVSLFNEPNRHLALTRIFIQTDAGANLSCFFAGQPVLKEQACPSLFATGDYVAFNRIYTTAASPLLTSLFQVSSGQAAKSLTVIPKAFLQENSFPFRIAGRTREYVVNGQLGRALIIEDMDGTQRLVQSHGIEGLKSARYAQAFLATEMDLTTARIIPMPAGLPDTFWPPEYNA